MWKNLKRIFGQRHTQSTIDCVKKVNRENPHLANWPLSYKSPDYTAHTRQQLIDEIVSVNEQLYRLKRAWNTLRNEL